MNIKANSTLYVVASGIDVSSDFDSVQHKSISLLLEQNAYEEKEEAQNIR